MIIPRIVPNGIKKRDSVAKIFTIVSVNFFLINMNIDIMNDKNRYTINNLFIWQLNPTRL